MEQRSCAAWRCERSAAHSATRLGRSELTCPATWRISRSAGATPLASKGPSRDTTVPVQFKGYLFIYLFIPFFPHSAFVCGNLGAAFSRCCLLSKKALSPREANDAPEHSDLDRDFKRDPGCAVVPEPFLSREKPRGAVTQPCLSHASPSRRAPGGPCFASTRAFVGDEPRLRPR